MLGANSPGDVLVGEVEHRQLVAAGLPPVRGPAPACRGGTPPGCRPVGWWRCRSAIGPAGSLEAGAGNWSRRQAVRGWSRRGCGRAAFPPWSGSTLRLTPIRSWPARWIQRVSPPSSNSATSSTGSVSMPHRSQPDSANTPGCNALNIASSRWARRIGSMSSMLIEVGEPQRRGDDRRAGAGDPVGGEHPVVRRVRPGQLLGEVASD